MNNLHFYIVGVCVIAFVIGWVQLLLAPHTQRDDSRAIEDINND